MIDGVVAPVLHAKPAPLNPEAVRTEFPQLFTTETEGAAGTAIMVADACCEVAEQPALVVIVTV